MKKRWQKKIVIAFLVSILIHIGFLVWSYFVKILPAMPFPEKVESVFHVKIDTKESVGEEKLKFDTTPSQKIVKSQDRYTKDKAITPSLESEELFKNNIQSSVEKNKQALVQSASEQNQVIRKSEFNDVVVTKKVRRSLRENLVDIGEVPHENFASGSPVLNAGEDISKSFLDKSMVFVNKVSASPMQLANQQNEFQMMAKFRPGIEHDSKSTDLGTALTYQLSKYQDPKTGEKYFKLLVKVRDATINFPVIPKEIIFLVDASASIGLYRLKQCEAGLIYSLKHLNPNDRFNIIVFKDKSIPFKPESVKPDSGNIKEAVEFLEDLRSWSTTDLYNVLRLSVSQEHPFVPSYRVFMSDGIPTQGIVDARQVINEISKINANRVSIFTFGGGVAVDPYMLDFIAFKNRGWSRVIDREYFMGRELAKLYDEIKDPLLLNVRYYASGLNDKEIFPQTMPDFFKGSQFVIYGKYTTESAFVVQIRGDIAPDKKQFLVNADLKNAKKGDKQIAHDWAFHKVYYLISQLKYNNANQALLRAIEALCTKFNITTPYSMSYPKTNKTAINPQISRKKIVKSNIPNFAGKK